MAPFDVLLHLLWVLLCTSVVAQFAHWHRQDHLLLNVVFAFVSEIVMLLMAMTTTSCEALVLNDELMLYVLNCFVSEF